MSCLCCCPRRCWVYSDRQKQETARGSQREEKRFVKVVRDGREQLIQVHNAIVGDIVLFEPGCRLPSRSHRFSPTEIICRCLGKWSLKYSRVRLADFVFRIFSAAPRLLIPNLPDPKRLGRPLSTVESRTRLLRQPQALGV